MKNLDLNSYGVQEMDAVEMKTTDGGFVPLVIWGIVITAEQVAAGAAIIFGGALAAGVAVAASEDK